MKAEELQNYRLANARMRSKVVEKANSTGLMSLRDEVALARYMLEEALNKVDCENDLIIQHSSISELVDKIGKLVVSCHKLELSTNSVMDEKQLIALAGSIVSAITTAVDEEDLGVEQASRIKGKLASSIVSLVQEATTPGEK